jgi:hypothetical protein
MPVHNGPHDETEHDDGRERLVANQREMTPTRRRLAGWRTAKLFAQIVISQLAAWALRHWL